MNITTRHHLLPHQLRHASRLVQVSPEVPRPAPGAAPRSRRRAGGKPYSSLFLPSPPVWPSCTRGSTSSCPRSNSSARCHSDFSECHSPLSLALVLGQECNSPNCTGSQVQGTRAQEPICPWPLRLASRVHVHLASLHQARALPGGSQSPLHLDAP